MIAVCQRSVIFIHVRDDGVNEALPKGCAGRCIPVMVIREDDDKWNRFSRVNQLIQSSGYTKAHPLILIVGLPMYEIKHWIAS
jgi:hypothetical protein